MRILKAAVFLAAAFFLSGPAAAQTVGCTGPTGGNCVPTVPYTTGGAISTSNPLPVNTTSIYGAGPTSITGNATGTTGAVVGTLAGTSGKTTYICGFNVSALGGTATVGPVTVAGLIGSSQVYQLPVNATAGQILVTQTFNPCIAASAANTAITVTTTANGTATAVDVNSWGFQQ